MILPPHGLPAIRAAFGDIRVANGKIVGPPGWESACMKIVSDLPGVGRRVYLNRAIEAPLRLALQRCIDRHDGYVIRTLGCFAPRASRSDANRLSTHSWGIAVDINADTNPRQAPLTMDLPMEWVAEFEAVGWRWGGRFRTPDPMHFQWCSGY